MEIPALFIYFAILFAKIIEVSLQTLRIVLITKGERFVGAVLGFIEVMIWLTVVGTVLDGIKEDPIKMIVYALGFSLGNYIGSMIEERLAFGDVTITSIIEDKEDCLLVETLRDNDFAVTVMDGRGRDSNKKVLMIFIRKTSLKKVISIIEANQPNAVITTSDVKPISKIFGVIRK